METKLTKNQAINQIIYGDYLFEGNHYNTLSLCEREVFENCINFYKNAEPSADVWLDETEHTATVYINEGAAFGYDKDRQVLYISVVNTLNDEDAEQLQGILESYSMEDIENTIGEIVAEQENDSVVTDKEVVLDFISFLEGYALRFKEFHWDSDKKAKHETAEKAYDLVYALEDSIAEDMMGFTESRIKPGTINPVTPADRLSPPQDDIEVDIVMTLQMLADDTFSFYKKIEHNNNFIGIRSEVENFMHELRQLIYLAKMA
jgi:hypothetical protein